MLIDEMLKTSADLRKYEVKLSFLKNPNNFVFDEKNSKNYFDIVSELCKKGLSLVEVNIEPTAIICNSPQPFLVQENTIEFLDYNFCEQLKSDGFMGKAMLDVSKSIYTWDSVKCHEKRNLIKGISLVID